MIAIHTKLLKAMTQIRTPLRFLYSAPTPKFHYPVFIRSEVIVLTNTPINKKLATPPTHKFR